MYGYGYRYSVRPGYVPFNPLTDIDGLSLYLNKNTNVNTKIAADFVAANSEYLSSSSVDLNKGNEDFAFSCWVYMDFYGTNSNLLGKWNATGNQRSFLMQFASGTDLRFNISPDGTSTANGQIACETTTWIGNWNFLSVVHDSVNDIIKCSVNGNDFTTSSYSGGAFASSTADLVIGGQSGAINYFDGKIDALNFYDKALTLAEIQALYNSGNGTSYPNLTNYNGDTYAIGQLLDGSTDAFNIDSVLTPLAATTTGEIELYVTPTDATPISNQRLISFAVATNSSEYFIIDNRTDGKCKVTFREGSVNRWVIDTDNVVFSNGLQAKINLIQDGTPTILIDDVEVAQTLTGANQAYWFNDFTVTNGRIGNFNFNSAGEGAFFEGIIQNVKIWSDATQTTQVAEWLMNDVEGANQVDSVGIYDATPIGTPVSTLASVDNTTIATIESSLISWWDLNEQSGTRFDAVTASANDLTDNNTVGYALGKVQDETVAGEAVWNWIDQSSNAFIFQNDTVTKQPLLSANSIDFDGTDDSLELTVTDVFNDTSGVLFFSGYWDNTSADILIASADTSVTNKYLYVSITAGVVSFWWRNGGTATEIQTTNAITNGSFYSFSIQSTGTAYKIILNGVNENLIVASGANDGNWFGDITTSRDNLTLSTLVRTTDLPFSSSLNKIIYSNANLTDSKITQINNFMSNHNN